MRSQSTNSITSALRHIQAGKRMKAAPAADLVARCLT
jgi:hypothetical protein